MKTRVVCGWGEDSMAFREWRKAVQRRCREQHWVLASGVSARLLQQVGRITRRIIFAGFYTLSTAQRRVQAALRDAGVEVVVVGLSSAAPVARKVSFGEPADELEAAIRWARALLERGTRSIGVIVPDLSQRRMSVERCFDAILDSSRDYELSVAPSLASVPMVRDALLMLRLVRASVPMTEVEQVLRSPFVRRAEEEIHQRSNLLGALRQRGKPELSLGAVRRHTRTAPALDETFARAQAMRNAWPRSQSIARWTVAMSEWLRVFGWPGDSAPGQTQTEAIAELQEVFTELGALGMISGAIDVHAALSKLERLCAARRFRVRQPAAPIQVMTVDESVGLEFEQLWVSGLHDGVWPPAPRPNPFLPGAWMRRFEVAHSTPAWELEFAARITTMWKGAADEVVLSHPLQQGDVVLRPSPVLRDLRETTETGLPRSAVVTARQQLQLARPGIERVRDFIAPAVAEQENIRGGTGVFKNQAACAFRGFAIHRLGVAAFDAASLGLDAMDRGSLVHEVLALVWKQIRAHAELERCTAKDIESLVLQCVDATFEIWERRRPGLLEGRFADIERERLTRLVGDWLALEKQRPGFVVHAWESESRVRVGNIPITIRPDRIDRLDSGGLLIIDYKTGEANRSSWFGERMDEPQLPLYCTAIDTETDRVAGVTFASLKTGKMGFAGVAERDGVAMGIAPASDMAVSTAGKPSKEPGRAGSEWASLKQRWRDGLDQLAVEFLRGDAMVDPKSADSCRQCRIWPLCRIGERSTLDQTEESSG